MGSGPRPRRCRCRSPTRTRPSWSSTSRPGWSCTRRRATSGSTLVNALLHHDAALREVPRAGVVHRLDKETSGLCVVARTLVAHTHLVRQLQSREMGREYLAVVLGDPPGKETIEATDRAPPEGQETHGGRRWRSSRRHALPGRRAFRRLRAGRGAPRDRAHAPDSRAHDACRSPPLIGDPVYGRRRTATLPGVLRDEPIVDGFRPAGAARRAIDARPSGRRRLADLRVSAAGGSGGAARGVAASGRRPGRNERGRERSR